MTDMGSLMVKVRQATLSVLRRLHLTVSPCWEALFWQAERLQAQAGPHSNAPAPWPSPSALQHKYCSYVL